MEGLNKHETAMIIAALRMLQTDLVANPDRVEAMPQFDDGDCLCSAEIDELIEKLNFRD